MKRSQHLAESGRRREIEACLARWELVHRPRRLAADRAPVGDFGARLRGACAELGPVFLTFARFLASRVDLLPASDCLALAAPAGGALPSPAADVGAVLVAELGGRAEKAFAKVAAEPFASDVLVQSHRARLVDGTPVIVRCARLGLSDPEELDLELLPFLTERLAAPGVSLERVVSGFQQDLALRADLRSTAQAIETLAADAEVFGRLVAPALHRDLTTARVLTHSDLEGSALAADGAPAVAAQLCVVWLRQALLGRVAPLDWGTDDIRVLPGGRIGIQGLSFARMLAPVQPDLRTFLVAVASRDPDEACGALLRQLVPEEGAVPEEQLLLQLRQIVPFRDGAWSPSGESLAEHAFVYARTARSCGYRPSQPLLAFYRSLFAVAAATRDLVPEGDPLADGLQELRVLVSLAQMRGAMRPEQWGGQLDRYAMLMTAMPAKLDELLTLASTEGGRGGSREPRTRPRRSAEGSHLLLAALLMAFAALALLLHNLAAAGVVAGPGEKAGAALFLAAGGLVLWALGRGGGR